MEEVEVVKINEDELILVEVGVADKVETIEEETSESALEMLKRVEDEPKLLELGTFEKLETSVVFVVVSVFKADVVDPVLLEVETIKVEVGLKVKIGVEKEVCGSVDKVSKVLEAVAVLFKEPELVVERIDDIV